MYRWWSSLGRGEQVGLIGVAATLVVGLVGALPAYFVFIQVSDAKPSQASSTSSSAVATTTSLSVEPATTSPGTESTATVGSGNAIGANWSTTAAEYEDHLGERFTFFCPPSGTAASVWGTDLYTSDSSVCTAAVHADLITLRDGGNVTIQIREGAQGYSSSARHGIETSDFGPWEASFEFAA
jgi:LCCL domain